MGICCHHRVTSPDRIPGAPNWSSRQHLSDTSIQQCSATLGTSVLPTKCGESGLSYTWQAAFHTNWTRHRGWDPCVLKGSRSKRTWYCSQDKRIFLYGFIHEFSISMLNAQQSKDAELLWCSDGCVEAMRTDNRTESNISPKIVQRPLLRMLKLVEIILKWHNF